jgi:dipeptidyl aminopeptidase/acylaminoacyl peptidase
MVVRRWLLLLIILFPGAANARKVTLDDLMRLRSIVDVRISPDGEKVAYVVSEPSFEKDAHGATLYLVPASGGTPVRWTHSTRIFNRPLPRPRLRWSPDGAQLSFLAFAGDVPQVLALPMSGGEPRPLTRSPQGVSSYEWSPDGKRLAFLSPDPPSAEEERLRKEKAFVIEVDRQDRPARLSVQELDGAARVITPPDHFVSGFDWAPDGEALAYSAAFTSGFTAQFHTRIYTVPAVGGAPRALVDRDGMNTSPRYSPDGRWVAFISTDGKPAMVCIWGLHVAPTSGGAIRNLSLQTGSWVGEFLWEATSASLLYVPNEGTNQRGARMFEQPVTRVLLDGTSEVLSAGETVNFSLSSSRDGRRLALRSVGPRDMGDVYTMDLSDRQPRRLTEANPLLKELDLGKLEAFRWTSFDGMEIWGLLLTPSDHRVGERLPLIVYVHGGPIGGFTYGLFPQFMHTVPQVDPYPAEALAAEGAAVLFPMPRGGSGYGLEGFRMIVNGWGQGDYRDIMAGVDHLVAQGLADPERLGVMGASYGGYMVDWIVTQTDRFRAASSGASICDIADLYYLSDAGEFTVEYFGLPWEAAEVYRRHSAITYVRQVKTPLLLQHGEMDMRVPVEQAKKFYQALKRLGKTVELEIYPRGGHVLYEPDLEREQMRRNLDWFRRWLALPVTDEDGRR